ncbi:MAG TPA: hypothetical protein VLH85_08245 [Levilinea sp.]|nr:hypothetical protein [Levilinea sp.]
MSIPPPAQFRTQSEMIDYLALLENRITEMESQNQKQLAAIEDLQQRPQPHPLEARLPKTNLLNPNFLKRAFAVWGHYFVATLLISLMTGAIYLVIFVALLAASGVFSR